MVATKVQGALSAMGNASVLSADSWASGLRWNRYEIGWAVGGSGRKSMLEPASLSQEFTPRPEIGRKFQRG